MGIVPKLVQSPHRMHSIFGGRTVRRVQVSAGSDMIGLALFHAPVGDIPREGFSPY